MSARVQRLLSLVSIVAIVGIFAVAASSQAPRKKTVVTGFSAYVLGTNIQTVLKADSQLQPGTSVPLLSMPTVQYTRRISAPIRDFDYAAILLLIFWASAKDGPKSLAVINLTWTNAELGSAATWKSRTSDLLDELRMSYEASMVRYDRPTDNIGGYLLQFTDAQGNRLDAFASSAKVSLALTYWWGPLLRANPSPAPSPTSRY